MVVYDKYMRCVVACDGEIYIACMRIGQDEQNGKGGGGGNEGRLRASAKARVVDRFEKICERWWWWWW